MSLYVIHLNFAQHAALLSALHEYGQRKDSTPVWTDADGHTQTTIQDLLNLVSVAPVVPVWDGGPKKGLKHRVRNKVAL